MFQGGWRWGGGGRSSSGDSDRGKGGGGVAIVIAIALVAVAWLLSVVIRFALSRKREYLADAGSVELTKDPDAMISALRKIEGRGELEGATSAVMEMCIDNPREGFADLFATHPSIESRVAALVQFAGGHDPGPLELPRRRTNRRSRRAPEQPEQPRPAPGAPMLRSQAVPAGRTAGHTRRTSIRPATPGPGARHGATEPIPAEISHPTVEYRGNVPPPQASAIELDSPSAMFPTSVGAIPRRFGREGWRMAKPAVILVGADKGGVGKTTVSRALLDYFIAHNIPTRAFDTEARRAR